MMGVVYYANYLRYFEAGRSELMRAAGLEYKALEAMGFGLPVTDAQARYHASATYDDELEVTTVVEDLRFASIRMTYVIERVSDGAKIASGETTHACVDSNGKVRRLPAQLKSALAEDDA